MAHAIAHMGLPPALFICKETETAHIFVLETRENFDLSQRSLTERLVLEGGNLFDGHAFPGFGVQSGAVREVLMSWRGEKD